jgi:RHO protein GDP dissociation inhibitor
MADATPAPESDYKVPEKVDPNSLLKDAEADGDAALAEYTKKLLGETYSPADDDRRVVILELRVICENRPDGDIVYTLDDAASIKAMKKSPFQLKENCKYKIQV